MTDIMLFALDRGSASKIPGSAAPLEKSLGGEVGEELALSEGPCVSGTGPIGLSGVLASLDEHGGIDILVNCAGTIGGHRVEDTSVAEFERIWRANVVSAFICCQRIGRHMVARGRGRIINVASIFGLVAGRPQGPSLSYVTSKHGLLGLNKELAVQWAKTGVTVNAIAPAYFPSEMVSAEILARADVIEDIRTMSPMGRPGELSELQGVVVFLASDSASYITGQTICVDGGWTVR